MIAQRPLGVVIDRMLAAIPPETEPQLRVELLKIRSSVLFTAPEVMPELWSRCSVALERTGRRVFATQAYWFDDVLRIYQDA